MAFLRPTYSRNIIAYSNSRSKTERWGANYIFIHKYLETSVETTIPFRSDSFIATNSAHISWKSLAKQFLYKRLSPTYPGMNFYKLILQNASRYLHNSSFVLRRVTKEGRNFPLDVYSNGLFWLCLFYSLKKEEENSDMFSVIRLVEHGKRYLFSCCFSLLTTLLPHKHTASEWISGRHLLDPTYSSPQKVTFMDFNYFSRLF